MLAQAHGYPGISPAGRSPVVLHPNASHGLAPPYDAAPARRYRLGSATSPKPAHWRQETIRDGPVQARINKAEGSRGCAGKLDRRPVQ